MDTLCLEETNSVTLCGCICFDVYQAGSAPPYSLIELKVTRNSETNVCQVKLAQ